MVLAPTYLRLWTPLLRGLPLRCSWRLPHLSDRFQAGPRIRDQASGAMRHTRMTICAHVVQWEKNKGGGAPAAPPSRVAAGWINALRGAWLRMWRGDR